MSWAAVFHRPRRDPSGVVTVTMLELILGVSVSSLTSVTISSPGSLDLDDFIL